MRRAALLSLEERRRRYVQAAVDRVSTMVADASPGERNDTLFQAACQLAELPGDELDEARVVDILSATADQAGLPADEAVRTIRSGVRTGRRNPRCWPEDLQEGAGPSGLICRGSSRRCGEPPAASCADREPRHHPERDFGGDLMVRGTRWASRNEPANGEAFELTWDTLAALLREPEARLSGVPKDKLPQWTFANFRERTEAQARAAWEREKRHDPKARLSQWGPCYRSADTLIAVHALCLDLDNAADASPDALRAAFGWWAFLAHTTPSHRVRNEHNPAGEPRWRVILPLARPATPQEAEVLCRRWAPRFCQAAFRAGANRDKKCLPKQPLDVLPPAQGMYVPAPGPHYEHLVSEGPLLNPDEVLAALDPPENPSTPAAAQKVAEAHGVLEGWAWADELGEDWLAAQPTPTPALLMLPSGPDCPAAQGEVPFLPAGKVAVLVSPGGRGKSQALAQLALSVAAGVPWLGTYPVARPGPVLLCYGEEDEEEARRRLQRAARALGIAPRTPGDADTPEMGAARTRAARNLALLPLYGRPASLVQQRPGTGASELAGTVMARLGEPRPGEAAPPQWSAVILDPAARFAGQESETDNAAATRFVEVLEQLTKLPGRPAVILAHHTNKGALSATWTDQGAARGSSAFVDGVRWVANLDLVPLDIQGPGRPGHGERMRAAKDALRRSLGDRGETGCFLLLHVEKTNYGPQPEPLLLFNWCGWLELASQEERAALKAAQEAARNAKDVAENTGRAHLTVGPGLRAAGGQRAKGQQGRRSRVALEAGRYV